jgi:hypothetical protein
MWSVAAVGKPKAVAREIATQFRQGEKCAEDEERIRKLAAALIAEALSAERQERIGEMLLTDDSNIKVRASSSTNHDFATKTVRRWLSISIEPL